MNYLSKECILQDYKEFCSMKGLEIRKGDTATPIWYNNEAKLTRSNMLTFLYF